MRSFGRSIYSARLDKCSRSHRADDGTHDAGELCGIPDMHGSRSVLGPMVTGLRNESYVSGGLLRARLAVNVGG
jgi:hypothetical protein